MATRDGGGRSILAACSKSSPCGFTSERIAVVSASKTTKKERRKQIKNKHLFSNLRRNNVGRHMQAQPVERSTS